MPPDMSFDDLGGLGELKRWLKVRSSTFSEGARKYGIPFAKGTLLAGIAGTGKSAIAKALSKEWDMPCFQVDLGTLFSGTVGSTEANVRRLIRLVEAVGKCILYVDEAEKCLNVSAVAGSGDSGTSSRLFATLLTWLNDHTCPVFTILTTNNFTILPPELIRKGRLSELFWLDIPDAAERTDIWNVIIKRYKREPANFNVSELVDNTADYTGAEIQELFVSAMTNAFFEGKEVSTKHVLEAIGTSRPQAVINAKELAVMREHAASKLRSAKGIAKVGNGQEYREVRIP